MLGKKFKVFPSPFAPNINFHIRCGGVCVCAREALVETCWLHSKKKKKTLKLPSRINSVKVRNQNESWDYSSVLERKLETFSTFRVKWKCEKYDYWAGPPASPLAHMYFASKFAQSQAKLQPTTDWMTMLSSLHFWIEAKNILFLSDFHFNFMANREACLPKMNGFHEQGATVLCSSKKKSLKIAPLRIQIFTLHRMKKKGKFAHSTHTKVCRPIQRHSLSLHGWKLVRCNSIYGCTTHSCSDSKAAKSSHNLQY